MECWSIGVLRQVRIAPASRVGDAERAAEVREFGAQAAFIDHHPDAALRPTDSVSLSGRISEAASPGLKPWAVLLHHFMVKSILVRSCASC